MICCRDLSKSVDAEAYSTKLVLPRQSGCSLGIGQQMEVWRRTLRARCWLFGVKGNEDRPIRFGQKINIFSYRSSSSSAARTSWAAPLPSAFVLVVFAVVGFGVGVEELEAEEACFLVLTPDIVRVWCPKDQETVEPAPKCGICRAEVTEGSTL